MSSPTDEDHLTDYHLAKLSDELKRVTWVIKIDDGKPTVATGFAIKFRDFMNVNDEDVLLLSCAHILNNKEKYSIMARKIDDKGFILGAEIIAMKPTWDLSLLVVKGGNAIYGAEFAEDGAISSCQTLLHVGHSQSLVYSVFVGRAVYPCVNDCLPRRREICASYVCSSLNATPDYRIMGHVFNKDYFREHQSINFPYEKTLYAHIPIIQCAGLYCESICAGGPVFNTQGHIVGMIIGEKDGCEIAIHVALLKEFVRMNSTTN
ncbi:hypothetical protein Leryth_021141 [Lithospermum erythrorhizon]|nr:hypothetical protein Leryth_021141 [Lithospermum erythrorhizon]